MPWVQKRPATTPDTLDAPPAKRTAPSSPEEGEVDDGATPPKRHDDSAIADAVTVTARLPTPDLPAKPSTVKVVPFPFKNKKPVGAVVLEEKVEMKVDSTKLAYERPDESERHVREGDGRRIHSHRSRSRDVRRGERSTGGRGDSYRPSGDHAHRQSNDGHYESSRASRDRDRDSYHHNDRHRGHQDLYRPTYRSRRSPDEYSRAWTRDSPRRNRSSPSRSISHSRTRTRTRTPSPSRSRGRSSSGSPRPHVEREKHRLPTPVAVPSLSPSPPSLPPPSRRYEDDRESRRSYDDDRSFRDRDEDLEPSAFRYRERDSRDQYQRDEPEDWAHWRPSMDASYDRKNHNLDNDRRRFSRSPSYKPTSPPRRPPPLPPKPMSVQDVPRSPRLQTPPSPTSPEDIHAPRAPIRIMHPLPTRPNAPLTLRSPPSMQLPKKDETAPPTPSPQKEPLKPVGVHAKKRVPVKRTREEEKAAYGRIFQGCGQRDDYDMLSKLGEGTFGYVPTYFIMVLVRHSPAARCIRLLIEQRR